MPIPHDCRDGFLMAYWRRPEALPRPGRAGEHLRLRADGRRTRRRRWSRQLRGRPRERRLGGAQRGDLAGARRARPRLPRSSSRMSVGRAAPRAAPRRSCSHRRRAAGGGRSCAQLLAVQAQDPRRRRALRARGARGAAASTRRWPTARSSSTWLLRGTLHLVAREDLGWLLALTGAARARRRRGAGSPSSASPPPARARRVDRAARSRDGAAGRARSSRERLARRGHPRPRASASPHLLGLAARRGALVLGPARVRADRRRGAARAAAPDRDAALAELARRYLPRPRPGDARRPRRVVGARAAATPAPGSRRSRRARRGELVDLAGAAPPRPRCRRACSRPSTRTCSAGATAASPSTPSTRGPSTRAAGSSARSRWSTAAPSGPGSAGAAGSSSRRSRRCPRGSLPRCGAEAERIEGSELRH